MRPKTQKADVRIPAELGVHLTFVDQAGTAIDEEVRNGWTRDVSGTGMSVGVALPKSLRDRLEAERDTLHVELDLPMGRRTVRVNARCMWVKPGDDSTLLGLEYQDVDAALAESIHEEARQHLHRPVVIKTALAVLAGAVVLGVAVLLTSQSASREEIERVESELVDASNAKTQVAQQLENALREAEKLGSSATATAESLQAKQAEIVKMQEEFEALRAQAAELSVALATARNQPPPGMADSAEWHYDRANEFAEEDNLPAALLEYETAVDLAPDMAEAYLEIATITDLYGRTSRSVAAYERYLSLRPGASDAFEIRQKIKELKADLKPPKTPKTP